LAADGVPTERISVHHNFCPDPGEGAGTRTDEVLYAGKLTEDKGVRLLLDTWTRAPDMPGRLLIAGRGPLEDDVRAVADAHGSVTYLGGVPLDDLTAIRRRCSAAVVPSLWEEPFGLTAVEAMAAGTPVVTTGTGGLADIVDETTGWLVEPTENGLAAGLAAAVADRGLRGTAARARYLEHFTEEVAVRRLVGHYEAVANA
jgi:glycosyltransferase involved in cell wall biosynthesis